MSASQDKKRRQAEREAGTSPKTLAEREAEKKAKKERRTWTIVGVIIAVFVVLIVLLNTNLLYTGTTAMTIGDYKFGVPVLLQHRLQQLHLPVPELSLLHRARHEQRPR